MKSFLKPIILASALLTAPLGYAQAQVLFGVVNGASAPACTTTTFNKDGTTVGNNTGAGTSIATPGFSTTFCNNLVIAQIATSTAAGPIISVTDAQSHLTFTKRASESGSGSNVEIWTAPLSGAALSGDAITATSTSSGFISLYVNSISGYKTSAPFDTNGALPSKVATGNCSFTTSNANDILYGVAVQNAVAPDFSWTLLSDSNNSSWFDFGEFQIVSATQSGVTASTLSAISICDAIQKGP